MSAGETKVAITAVATAVSAELAVMTTDVVNYLQPQGEGLIIRGFINITAGAGTTAVVVKCRRGVNTITGAVIGPAAGLSHTLAAAAVASIPFEFLDIAPTVTPPVTATGAQSPPTNVYSVTVQQTGGTGAGTVNYGTAGIESATGGW